ncbi:MAG: FtsX-like permease family protein [Candidatus Lokiarchaeota archaeon]|nr:FtsX-like permease family protein [Candidatus Lokiarchaeota archaeon]
MKLRIFWKTFSMARRSGRRFIVFVTIYAFLIAITAYFLKIAITLQVAIYAWFTILVIVMAIVVSSLYGYLVCNYRRREIATLRTIGWDAGSIRTLFLSELFLVFISAILVVLEIIFHIVALTYWAFAPTPPEALQDLIIPWWILSITLVIIFGCQLPGILFGYRKILKVRPMEAMRKA